MLIPLCSHPRESIAAILLQATHVMGIQAKYYLCLETSSTKDIRSLDIRVLLKLVIKSAWQESCPGPIVFCTFVHMLFTLFYFSTLRFSGGLSTLNFMKQGSICSWLVLTSVFLLLYQTSHSTKEKGYRFHVFEGLWQNGNIWSPRSEKGLLIHLSLTIALPPCCVFNLQWVFFSLHYPVSHIQLLNPVWIFRLE